MALPLSEVWLSDIGLANVAIEVIEASHAGMWAETVCQGLFPRTVPCAELLETVTAIACSSSTRCFLARIEGQIAGAAALTFHDGVANVFGASTLPEHRGRGVHTALLRARLQWARREGYEIAASVAVPGSGSSRNILRCGFRVLYTRVKFEGRQISRRNQGKGG